MTRQQRIDSLQQRASAILNNKPNPGAKEHVKYLLACAKEIAASPYDESYETHTGGRVTYSF